MTELAITTPAEDAADNAVVEAIENLVRQHKPEDFMLTLGVLFAQGLAECSEKCRDEALNEFVYRLWKYCRIELQQGHGVK